MKIEIVSVITNVETIAKGNSIRDLSLLRKQHGLGNWRKMKGIARVRLSEFLGSEPKFPALQLARRVRCDAPQRNWCLTPITPVIYAIYTTLFWRKPNKTTLLPSPMQREGEPSKAVNLIWRLRQYSDDVWRFMTQANVPFTNNLAEQAVRMPKVKQKVSGCFRTTEGAHTYCVIRSYVATMQKQGGDVFAALVSTFKGHVPQPNFG